MAELNIPEFVQRNNRRSTEKDNYCKVMSNAKPKSKSTKTKADKQLWGMAKFGAIAVAATFVFIYGGQELSANMLEHRINNSGPVVKAECDKFVKELDRLDITERADRIKA